MNHKLEEYKGGITYGRKEKSTPDKDIPGGRADNRSRDDTGDNSGRISLISAGKEQYGIIL